MNYEITEEQIKELATGNAKVKKWFPEVFETKLEVGKWYNWRDNLDYVLWFITKTEDEVIYSYGFLNSEFIKNGVTYSKGHYSDACSNLRTATDSEVLKALKNEFEKQNPNIETGNWYYNKGGNTLAVWLNGEITTIFDNGVFTKFHTKEEAEKLLNAKII